MITVYARSTGRKMQLLRFQDYGEGPLAEVRPHPKDPKNKSLERWERNIRVVWDIDSMFFPGVSEPLDLFERAEWKRFNHDNLKEAV